ncbi:MAG: pyrroloquinoline quinone biosynthesis protein PqqB [Rhodopseudomonas sp.]|nr:pyrroloquinoline quinone biosynthesis protein PqqB [Rhodopseudomonas sp.]
MTALVLGSAAGGAFPQWNCRCPVCQLAWAGDGRVRPRTQTSVAVSGGAGPDGAVRWTLLNAAPDLGQQIRATPALHPRTGAAANHLRGSPIDAVLLTGAEIDQIAGLVHVRENTPFTLYATPESHAAVAGNAMFGAMTAMTRRAIVPGDTIELAGGVTASLFTVPGKAPLYLEGDDPRIGVESADTVGVDMQRDGARLVFVPGAAAINDAMRDRFARADVLLFDGTLFTDDEMLRAGTGAKTGRRMGHMPVGGDDGTLQSLAGLTAATRSHCRRIFIHINNTNPMLIDGSPERARVEAAGWEVAYDGMEIVL